MSTHSHTETIMPQHQTDTEQTLQAVIEEYSHSDMALGPQIPAVPEDREEATRERLEIMAHAHIHAAIALMKASGLTQEQIAGDFYVLADSLAAP
jgi:hypothetical protein